MNEYWLLLFGVPLDWSVWSSSCASFVPILRLGHWPDYLGLYWRHKMVLVRIPALLAIMFAGISIGKEAPHSDETEGVIVVALMIVWLAFALVTHWRLLKRSVKR